MEERIDRLVQQFGQLAKQYGDTPCMAHTRGQQAIPITFGVKINAWLQPLKRQLERLEEMKKRLLVIQLGGAAGTLSVYEDKAPQLIGTLARELGLLPGHHHGMRKGMVYVSLLTGWQCLPAFWAKWERIF